jgi:chemotaxis protein methyltransferase CheR
LRATPPAARTRWFRSEGENRFALAAEIRDAVSFAPANLLDPYDGLLEPGAFEIILCRNVFIYLSTRAVAAVMDRFAAALPPGGMLILGSADATVPFLTGAASVPGVRFGQEPFDLETHGDASIYRRRPAAGPPSVRPAQPPRSVEPAPPSLTEVAAALRAGRFAEAARGADAILARSPQSPEARYVRALCCEQAGEPAAAMALHEEAIARDPGFALAHLRLGLLALQAGAIAEARRALSAAQRALPGEDERRLSLFGGGFRAEALAEIAAAALRRCGGGTP